MFRAFSPSSTLLSLFPSTNSTLLSLFPSAHHPPTTTHPPKTITTNHKKQQQSGELTNRLTADCAKISNVVSLNVNIMSRQTIQVRIICVVCAP